MFQECIGMVDQLRFNATFENAMLTVFGKTLICQNIDLASQFSKTANLDCVTLEGTVGKKTLSTIRNSRGLSHCRVSSNEIQSSSAGSIPHFHSILDTMIYSRYSIDTSKAISTMQCNAMSIHAINEQ